jgi:hypothetical protein
MSESARRQRAAGYIYLHDASAGAHALLFGRCGTDPAEIDYRLTIAADGSPTRGLRLRVRGDFTELLQSGLLSDLGRKPLSLDLQVNDERMSAGFEPDATNAANALIHASTGLSGVFIEVQSSAVAAVALGGVMIMAAVAWDVIAVGALIAIHTEARSEDGSANVDAEVEAHDDEGGDDGNGSGPTQ